MLNPKNDLGFKRKAVRLSEQALVKTSYMDQSCKFPLVLEPAVESLDGVAWARNNREFIESSLLKHGAVLMRGFDFNSLAAFEQFAQAVSKEILDYSEPSSPRHEVTKRIYTSTDYPASQSIHMHNEMSYAHNWPRKIFFFCQQPAGHGGETPIALGRRVWESLDLGIRKEFEAKRVMYVRNYSEGLGIPWQKVFQTSERATVEDYCRRAGIACEWGADERLKTRQVRRAVLSHPITGHVVWFNQAHAFHFSSLDPEVRKELLRDRDEAEMPRNAYYGDGSPIEDTVIAEIHQTYSRVSCAFQWRRGDLLALENMLTAHGRAPFTGPRQILVAMSDPVHDDVGGLTGLC